MQIANRVIKNTGFLYAKMGITMFVSLWVTRLILNSLGASDFGIFNVVGGAIAMLGFLNVSMASATQRFMNYAEGEGDKEKERSIFNVSVIMHLVIALAVGVLLVFAGYVFFGGVLNMPPDRVAAAKIVYGSLIVSTVFTVIAVPYDAVLNAHENMLFFSVVGVVESLLKLSVAFVVVYTSFDKLIVYGVLMSCIPLMMLCVMRMYCHRHYGECVISPRRYYDHETMKEMTSFAGWNLMSTSASMICNYGQGIIMNNFFGTIINAAQGVAGQLNGQLQVLSSNFTKAINPVMGKSAGARDKDLMKRSIVESSRVSSVLYLAVAIPVFVYAPYLLRLWLKNVPEWTIPFIRCMFIMNFIEYYFIPIYRAIESYGRIKALAWWNVVANMLPVVIVPVFFYEGSSPMMMYYFLIGVRVILLVGVMTIGQRFGLISVRGYVVKVILPLLALSASLIMVLYAMQMIYPCNDILSLLVSLFIYVVMLLLALYFFVSGYERQLMMSLWMSIIYKIRK